MYEYGRREELGEALLWLGEVSVTSQSTGMAHLGGQEA